MGLIKRWERQIDTPYSELSEAEKESDRKESRNYLPIIDNILEQERQRVSDEIYQARKSNTTDSAGDVWEKVLSIINK